MLIAVWYADRMDGIHDLRMGDRGRIVMPAAVRRRAGLSHGTPMVLVESADGLVLLTRRQLRDRVRRESAGSEMVESLLADRRASSAAEDAASAAEDAA